MNAAVASDRIALAFLARTAKEDPKAKTRVDSAKRAVNFLRSLIEVRLLERDPNVRLLARSARNAIARTVRQSPAFHAAFVKAILMCWGNSPTWWRRQGALMVVLAICTVARGAEITGCRRDGISWVRPDGTQVRTDRFSPINALNTSGLALLNSLRGFLILFPARKNKQSTPTWVPVISGTAITLLAQHLQWLDNHLPGEGGALFPARKPSRAGGFRHYAPSTKSPMSVNAFRKLLRLALVECCGLTPEQAKEFGTHSLRIGAIELLRQKGVPAAVRQQLGGWMSAISAIGYLQLPVGAQFNLLRRVFH
jgi:hypothetical protein